MFGAAITVGLSSGCGSNSPEAGVLTTTPLGDPGEPVAVGSAGGRVELTHDGVTFVLNVPAHALADSVEISLQPVRITELPDAVAVELQPAGTRFEVPATLVISPDPSATPLVSLLFEANTPELEVDLAVVAKGSARMFVPHFSTAGVAGAAQASAFLPSEIAELTAAANSTDPGALAGLAMGRMFQRVVAPLLPNASQNAPSFLRAERTFAEWSGIISIADFAVDEPHTLGGTQTVEELAGQTTTQLITAGTTVLQRITRPRCDASAGDVSAPRSWVSVPIEVSVAIAFLAPDAPVVDLCVDYQLTIDGATTMTATTTSIATTSRLLLTAPTGTPEKVAADFSFVATGAEGPPGPIASPDGVATQTFTRVVGDNRPRAVTIVVSAVTDDSELATIPPPKPATLIVVEDGTSASLSATPNMLTSAAQTALVCASATADNQPAQVRADVDVISGGGTLSLAVPTPDGLQTCATYTPPIPLPAAGGQVLVRALIGFAPALELPASTTITLGPGSMDIAITASPRTLAANGTSQVCAVVTSNGKPVPHYDINWTKLGPGSVNPTSSTVVTSDGKMCTTYTAPGTVTAQETVQLTATATETGVVGTNDIAITLGPPPSGPWTGTLTYTSTTEGLPEGAVCQTPGVRRLTSRIVSANIACPAQDPASSLLDCTLVDGTTDVQIDLATPAVFIRAFQQLGGTACTADAQCTAEGKVCFSADCAQNPTADGSAGVCATCEAYQRSSQTVSGGFSGVSLGSIAGSGILRFGTSGTVQGASVIDLPGVINVLGSSTRETVVLGDPAGCPVTAGVVTQGKTFPVGIAANIEGVVIPISISVTSVTASGSGVEVSGSDPATSSTITWNVSLDLTRQP